MTTVNLVSTIILGLVVCGGSLALAICAWREIGPRSLYVRGTSRQANSLRQVGASGVVSCCWREGGPMGLAGDSGTFSMKVAAGTFTLDVGTRCSRTVTVKESRTTSVKITCHENIRV